MSNPRTFIIPGDLSHLGRIAQFLTQDVSGILVHQHIAEKEARASGVCPQMSDRIFTLFSLTELTDSVPVKEDWPTYDRCLRGVLADTRTHYIATRSQLNSAFNNAILIEKIVVNTLRIIRQTQPQRLVSSSTPHSLEAWIFAKCFEILGLPVFVLERTPINNRAWIYSGLDTQTVVPRPNGAEHLELTPYTRKQVSEQRDSKPGQRDKKRFLRFAHGSEFRQGRGFAQLVVRPTRVVHDFRGASDSIASEVGVDVFEAPAVSLVREARDR